MTEASESAEISIGLITLDDTFPLRKAVLRPWLTPETSRAPFADKPERFHVGARQNGAEDGTVISTASFIVEGEARLNGLRPEAPRWRLRAMATDPDFQGCGLGGRVLSFGMDELSRRLAARGESEAVLWCNGRTGAERFYRRHGFSPIGDVFETPGTGPHYIFWRRVAAEDQLARSTI